MFASHTNTGLPVLAGIQLAELRRLGATLSLASPAIHDPDHVLHGQLVGQHDAYLGKLRSKRPFMPAAWKLLDSLLELDIRVRQWTKQKCNADYLESTSRVRALISSISSRPFGMSLPRTSWIKLNRLRTGVGRFHSSNGVSLHHRITNVTPKRKLQIAFFFMFPTSCTNRNTRSAGFGLCNSMFT